MHQSLARYSAPVSFVHAPSLADFITTIIGFKVFGTHSRVTIRTRTGLDWTKRFSGIAAAFDIPVDRAIFDGEVVAVKDGRRRLTVRRLLLVSPNIRHSQIAPHISKLTDIRSGSLRLHNEITPCVCLTHSRVNIFTLTMPFFNKSKM